MPFREATNGEKCKYCERFGFERFSKGSYKGRYCSRHWAESEHNDEAEIDNRNTGEREGQL